MAASFERCSGRFFFFKLGNGMFTARCIVLYLEERKVVYARSRKVGVAFHVFIFDRLVVYLLAESTLRTSRPCRML